MLQWEGSGEAKGSNEQTVGKRNGSVAGDARGGRVGIEGSSQLSLDDAFDILSNQRRRHVLQHLLSAPSESVQLGEMAEYVASSENDKDVSEVTSTERKRVYIGLYQNHLPRMDAVDVIDFDADRKEIRPGAHATDLARYLHDTQQRRRGNGDWAQYYLFLATCSGLVVLASVPTGGFLEDYRLLVFCVTITCLFVLSLVQLTRQAG
ncbi:hypothetical protein ACFR9U_19235 [Halorientalis brevis]|uniref:DUF7344 domain-containing protein n=1 Tax=Halorientalis brevis TaxID=1126241 RepID=A0ABD6CI70_9EURY|nr:hypothetical protein [Halorientalis brevis]